MKAYKNVMIEILELNEEIVRTSNEPTNVQDRNVYDDTIGAFGL